MVLSADKVTELLELKANSADVPDASGFATKENPEFTGKFSHGRQSGSTAGTRSVTIGDDNVASGEDSIAIGKGAYSSAKESIAIGKEASSSTKDSMAIGFGVSASGHYQTAFGRYNDLDPGELTSGEFEPGKQYYMYDLIRVKRQNGPSSYYWQGWECKTDHVAGESFDETEAGNWSLLSSTSSSSYANYKPRKKYLEIFGNGIDSDHKSNARTMDWKGNEELAGTFKCQKQITIGSTTMTEANLQALLALLNT